MRLLRVLIAFYSTIIENIISPFHPHLLIIEQIVEVIVWIETDELQKLYPKLIEDFTKLIEIFEHTLTYGLWSQLQLANLSILEYGAGPHRIIYVVNASA
jgi:hypothetical protein